jgi:hypothetical protein
VAALVGGCTSLGGTDEPVRSHLAREDPVGDCARLFAAMDRAIRDAGVRDAQYARVRGFPYLRIDRFLGSRNPGMDAAADHAPSFMAWVDELRDLDREARRLELRNLPPSDDDVAAWSDAADTCADTLRARDMADHESRRRLARVQVPDAYRTSARVAGLYPLASVPFLRGVRNLHLETEDTFATPEAELPVRGQLYSFAPSQSEASSPWYAFAPIWHIDVADDADRPGSIALEDAGRSRVTGEAVTYTYESRTRWYGHSLRQLNYVIWFPARPRQGPLDLLGGHLDGITWRITIGIDGQPLIYDVMHNCGCYHQFFPTTRVRLARRRIGWEEPVMVPQTLPAGPGRMLIRIASHTHYVQRVRRAAPEDALSGTAGYGIRQYDELRSLPVPDGTRRSLFAENGLVPGSDRRERWLFWPMGVPSAGAMRQRGHHAIAFVGRRHFDDADLLERYFEPEPGRP